MKLGTVSIPIDEQEEEALRQLNRSGISYTLFGDVVLLRAPESNWGEIVIFTEQYLSSELQVYPDPVEEDNLYLVVQLGSFFEIQNPDVPVVLNRGRHLAVILQPGQAQEINAKRECCYTLYPLKGIRIAVEVLVPPLLPGTPMPWVQTLVDNISIPNMRATIEHLSSFPTRFTFTDYFFKAAEWAKAELEKMGYRPGFQPVEDGRLKTVNVIADKATPNPSERDLILVTAHLDSINDKDNYGGIAPGADDNASGCAGVLEMARLLSEQTTMNDVRFILFGGEEKGLLGGKEYVESVESSADLKRTRAVINMDMIGKVNDSKNPLTVLLETDSSESAERLARGLAQAAATYSPGLRVEWSTYYHDSDHVSFIQECIPAALTIEVPNRGEQDQIIHTPNDVKECINDALMSAILRMNLAFVAETAGLSAPPQLTSQPTKKGTRIMSDQVNREDSSRQDSALGTETDQNKQSQSAMLRRKDHLPPIDIIDGSFVITTETPLTPMLNDSEVRPFKYKTQHRLKGVMIIDGHGIVLYRDRRAAGTNNSGINLWLRAPSSTEPHIKLIDLGANIEIESEVQLGLHPHKNPSHPKRENVYLHPHNATRRIFIHTIQVLKDNQTSFKCSVPSDEHEQGYEIWIWDEE